MVATSSGLSIQVCVNVDLSERVCLIEDSFDTIVQVREMLSFVRQILLLEVADCVCYNVKFVQLSSMTSSIVD